MKKSEIAKINEARKIISELKIADLKDEELTVALTQLKIILDDIFAIIKIKKGTDLPYVMKDGNI